jgi:hypothetical protein
MMKSEKRRNYIIHLRDGKYYAQNHAWIPVVIEKATKLTRVDAERIVATLKKLGYNTAYSIKIGA